MGHDPDLDPILASKADRAELVALDERVTLLARYVDGELADHETRLEALEDGTTPPPIPTIPATPDADDIAVVVNGREVIISVIAPDATMARFDIDPGPTIEEPGLSHVRTLDPGEYFAQVSAGNAAGWSAQSPQVPFTILDDTPEPEPPPAYADRVTPLVSSGPVLWTRFHDLAPNTTALQMTGIGWEAGHLVFERVCQAIFWADSGWLHDVDIWNFGRGGAGTSGQAHAVYGRSGLVERVRVHSADPSAPNGSSAFHAHKESGPVTGLTWRDCENHSGTDSVMAGYAAGMTDNVVDGFRQTAGKFRVGVAGEANGENHFDRLDLTLLQIDGASWAAGTRFSGRARQVVHAGGLPLTLDQVAGLYPSVDFSGLTIG